MRAPVSQSLLLVASAVVFAACSEAGGPVTPNVPLKPTTQPSALQLRTDGYIAILKAGSSSRASLNRVKSGARLATVMNLSASKVATDATVADVVPSIGGIVVRGIDPGELAKSADVAQVIPNYEANIIEAAPDASMVMEGSPAASPLGTDQSGALFFAANYQWNYKKVSANRVWVPSHAGAGAKVCITDSGIDPGHTAFIGKTIVSTSFIAHSAAQLDTNGHGSHVAGTISTGPFTASASVAPDASLMTAKVFAGNGGGGSAANIINAVAWCADNGADVISMSLGFAGGVPITGNEGFIAAFEAGLDYATNQGSLIVAAAGNDGVTLPVSGTIFLPAEAPGVTSVAATAPTTNLSPFGSAAWLSPGAQFDGIASYSNRGPVPSVDVSAPGGDFFSLWPTQSLILSVCSRQWKNGSSFPCAANNNYLFEAGTSMATPHVSGVAAIIRSRWPATVRSPAFRTKIESCLYKTVDVIGSTSIFGRGRVNAYKAATNPC